MVREPVSAGPDDQQGRPLRVGSFIPHIGLSPKTFITIRPDTPVKDEAGNVIGTVFSLRASEEGLSIEMEITDPLLIDVLKSTR